MVNTSALAMGIALFASIAAFLYKPIAVRLEVYGFKRQWHGFENVHGQGLTIIPDIFACEDLHYHEPSGILFGLTEANGESRDRWFPPMTRFEHPENLPQGSFFMLFPEEDHATRIGLEGFKGPFITHGFDIYTSPADEESLWFIAINHLPNPLATLEHPDIPKARSQIEIFSYHIGDLSAQHLRSIHHPIIRTPNDIYAVSERELYVTNDHQVREGIWRFVEDLGHDDFGAWSDIIHVSISDLTSKDASAGFTATVAMDNLQNPNGFGHGRNKDEILMGRAAGGVLSLLNVTSPTDTTLQITDQLQLPSNIDNPSYFHDRYPRVSDINDDASGYVLGGLAHGIVFPHPERNPVTVWLVQPPTSCGGDFNFSDGDAPLRQWKQSVVFADDGAMVNTASTAVLVSIDPERNGGRREAWLFVTGPLALGMARTKVVL